MSDCDTRGECFRHTIPTMYNGQIHPCQTVIQEVSVWHTIPTIYNGQIHPSQTVIQEVSVSDIQYQLCTIDKYIHVKLWYKRWVFQTYNTNNVQWTNTSMSVIQEVSVSDIQYQQCTMDKFIHVRLVQEVSVSHIQYQQYIMDKYIHVRLWYKWWVFQTYNTNNVQWTNTSMSDCDTRGECFRHTIPTMDKYIHVRLWYKRWVFQTYNTNNVQWTIRHRKITQANSKEPYGTVHVQMCRLVLDSAFCICLKDHCKFSTFITHLAI